MIDRAPTRSFSLLLVLAAAVLIGGCMTRPPAPVTEVRPLPGAIAPAPLSPPAALREPDGRPNTYTVKRGDTLHQIALDHGLNDRDLAAWNNIENVNRISVGQVLVLSAPGQPAAGGQPGPGGAVTAPLVTAPPVAPSGTEARAPAALAPASGRGNTATLKTEPRAVKLPYSEQALAQLQQTSPVPSPPVAPEARGPAPPLTAATSPRVTTAPPPRAETGRVPEIDDEKLDWVWPAQGKIISNFSETANLKGIDIAGKSGQPVLASASGKVVYAGSGLRGYGKLIIVKHNSTFLSAYAHNKEISVKEGQQVAKGQKIAEMGDTDADQVKLHFEIRRLGKPVDPTKFLPPA
ncbi:MAG TPA: peptidoglycan DD-metalloendopeptidase family protein [Casimicrobiaceae bacterium]|nr:peptidoglycan DD-metalloendopeptidase family protein [Casimicrobiaceae bacterium]